jgi:hypothetical protein
MLFAGGSFLCAPWLTKEKQEVDQNGSHANQLNLFGTNLEMASY